MDEKSSSISKRAFTAVCLAIGFYFLALVIIGILAYIPLAIYYSSGRISFQATLLCFGAAGTILVALIPPSNPFVAPGPLLKSTDHPRLFTEIENIAKEMDQEPPEEVYLIPQVNAWVMEYGGKRIMGVGLPLLSSLNISQFRAILVHEFGHYYSGDTKLGPWVYNTRAAISRTIKRLAEKEDKLLGAPFRAYGEMFLRITQKISRSQEFRADEVAANYAGGRALISGLKAVHAGSVGYDYFWRNELAPVLEEQYVPPVLAGFNEYMKLPQIEAAVSKAMEDSLKKEDDDTYDSHPPLKKRIEAIERRYESKRDEEEVPAIQLIQNAEILEKEMIVGIAQAMNKSDQLEPIAWNETNRLVYLPKWKKTVAAFSQELTGMSPESIPSLVQNPDTFFGKLYLKADGNIAQDDLVRQASYIIGASLAVALARKGWQAHTDMGSGIRMGINGELIDPFSFFPALVGNRMSPEEWRAICGRIGISQVDLGLVDEFVASAQVPHKETAGELTAEKDDRRTCPECGCKMDSTARECSECLRPLLD